MLPYCCVCKKNLKNKNSIYFGFDNNYCSEYCRYEFIKVIRKNDPRMLEPYKWKELSKKNTYSNLENIENDIKNLHLNQKEKKVKEENLIKIRDPPIFDKKIISNDKIIIKENDISLNNKLRLYDSEYQKKKSNSKKNKKRNCTYATIKYLINIILLYK